MNTNEQPRRKQRGILESIERPKGRGIKPKLRNKSFINRGLNMPKTITLRLSDAEYMLFSKVAKATKRPISNLINFLAHQKLEEDFFADQIEMDEILDDSKLLNALREGSKDVKQKKGTFVDV